MSHTASNSRKNSIHRRVTACALVVATGLPFLTACSGRDVESGFYAVARLFGMCVASGVCGSSDHPDASPSFRYGSP